MSKSGGIQQFLILVSMGKKDSWGCDRKCFGSVHAVKQVTKKHST